MQYSKFRIRSLTVLIGTIALMLALALLAIRHVIETEQAVAIGIATIIVITGWWAGARLRAIIDLESKASDEFIAALSNDSAELRDLMYGVPLYKMSIAPPSPTLAGFVRNEAKGYYDKLYAQHVKVVRAHTRLRESYEANEMALVRLADYFDYIKFNHDELIKELGKAFETFANSIPGIRTTADFIKSTNTLDQMSETFTLQLVLCLDMKKEVLNAFQAKLFGGKLVPRKPLNDSKVLAELATQEVIAKMRKERDAQLMS